jgi:predicted PurR-regulated permease PerM
MRTEAWLWIVRGAGLGIGLACIGAVAFAAVQAVHALVLVMISIILASGLEPAVDGLRARIGRNRSLSILLVYLGFFVVVVVLVVLIVPSAISQLGTLSERVPELLAQLKAWAATLRPEALADGLTGVVESLEAAVAGSPGAEPDPEALISAGLTVADTLIAVITVLTLVFFWLVGHQRMQWFTLALLPEERRGDTREAWNEVETRFGRWVRGQLILMASIFLMTTVAYFLLGLDNALLLGLIAGIAEIIPIVGPALGAIPALAVAALTGDPLKVLLVAAVYVVIQVVEGNVLVPVIMKRTIGVPPFLVVVSLIVGTAVAGITGALLAVPLAAALVVILERTQDRETPVQLEPLSAPEAQQDDADEGMAEAASATTEHTGRGT